MLCTSFDVVLHWRLFCLVRLLPHRIVPDHIGSELNTWTSKWPHRTHRDSFTPYSRVTVAQGTALVASAWAYHLPVGSSCLPMSAQRGAALPHRPAPTGEQRWLPAASTLVVVGQARCSSHWTRDHRWPCVQFNCGSNMEQSVNGSAVFWVTGHYSTPPENWTVRAFLQLTPCLSNDFTAAWLTFSFPQLFAVAATLKPIDYNVAMTFILNNNNNNNQNQRVFIVLFILWNFLAFYLFWYC